MSQLQDDQGKVLYIEPGPRPDLQTLTIATSHGTFVIDIFEQPELGVGFLVRLEWNDGAVTQVEWANLVLWQAHFCEVCGLSDAEHDSAECQRAAAAQTTARIAKYGECPSCDLGIDFASCICPRQTAIRVLRNAR